MSGIVAQYGSPSTPRVMIPTLARKKYSFSSYIVIGRPPRPRRSHSFIAGGVTGRPSRRWAAMRVSCRCSLLLQAWAAGEKIHVRNRTSGIVRRRGRRIEKLHGYTVVTAVTEAAGARDGRLIVVTAGGRY